MNNKKIAFIGLGTMGSGMARNLRKKGAELIVYDANLDTAARFKTEGFTVADGANVAAAAGDIVFLSLPNGNIVENVILQILSFIKPGTIVVDLSTIPYSTTLRIKKVLANQNICFLDAPVSGMKSRAEDGTLTAMCGGDEDAFIEVEPYLNMFSSKVVFMGETGAGQLAKLINQVLFDINSAALAEILPIGVKLGLDAEKVGEVVNSGTGRSYASEFFIPRILNGVFTDGYPMQEAYKDLVSAAELGANDTMPMPVLAAATATYQMALLSGYGEYDKGGMIRVFEELLGVQFRKAE